MRIQEKLKRHALATMTEKDTPFRPTHTQKVFKNAANVQLRGTTYDARHMDKFLESGFGEKSVQMDATGLPTNLSHQFRS